MCFDNSFTIYGKIPIENVLEFLFAKFLMSYHEGPDRKLFTVTINGIVPECWDKVYKSSSPNSKLFVRYDYFYKVSQLTNSTTLSDMLQYDVLDIEDMIYPITKSKDKKHIKVVFLHIDRYGYSPVIFEDEDKLKAAYKAIKEYRDKFPDMIVSQKFPSG